MTEIRFETVEDMVKYALSHPHDDTRFLLEDRSNWEFVGKEAGAAWYDARPPYEATVEYEKAEKAWRAAQPKQVQVTKWYLWQRSSGYHNKSIELSVKLGEMLDKVWKTGPAWKGSSYMKRIGNLTVAGMLRRLGFTDVSKQLKAVVAAEKLQQEKNYRNYNRREAKRLANELVNLMLKGEALGVKYPEFYVVNLLNLEEETK